MTNIGWLPGYGDKSKENVVELARKAAEKEIEAKEKDGELIKEKKEAILQIYDANYKAKMLLLEAETKKVQSISDTILDFMVEYNILMHQSMNIISIFNQENLKVDTKYYELQSKINRDTMDFLKNQIPELLKTLDMIESDSPSYSDYKNGISESITNLINSQRQQINNCHKQQSLIFESNQKLLSNCVKNLEIRVSERILPLFEESSKQIEITKKIEAIANERKMIG
ncbi:MAG: hypothetical protein PHF33_05110 [Candidatus Delongbacteria bacterium]|nr:hypothetical protein [Candidatus Delongbacteria bacterium]MDD4205013.1 hypothetical protein [Candidatus Delongbacteria bacterium]